MGGAIRRQHYQVPATVVRVIDGDTIVLDLDLGWHITRREACRIEGVDAPEMDTAEGRAAKRWAEQRLPAGTEVTFMSYRLDKYGRPLGEIILPGLRVYSTELQGAGHAVRMGSAHLPAAAKNPADGDQAGTGQHE